MTHSRAVLPTAGSYLAAECPDEPVVFLSPEILHETARRFLDGFPGLVSYALKANPDRAVIENLVAAGITAFDVASPAEIALMRQAAPRAVLHYHNPVRSRSEIVAARDMGVMSYSVDEAGELAKLAEIVAPQGVEISVRFKLPVAGAAYDFGAKFGAEPGVAAHLLAEVARLGYQPSLTFHPGTQCTDAEAWVSYIEAAADIARKAGVTPARLNVGGGFPARRMMAESPSLQRIFAAIGSAARRAFGAAHPALVCEPGRAMVAEAASIALRVKSLRAGGAVFVNDGIYGTLCELGQMGASDRIEVIAPDGRTRQAPGQPRTIWGPTCDSLDRLPGTVLLPGDLAEGDYVVFHGMGAYSTATLTRFNGYGGIRLATVRGLSGQATGQAAMHR